MASSIPNGPTTVIEVLPSQPMMPMRTIPLVTPLHPACAWCWYLLYPGIPFPEQESSTICAPHAEWMYQRYKSTRKTPVQKQ